MPAIPDTREVATPAIQNASLVKKGVFLESAEELQPLKFQQFLTLNSATYSLPSSMSLRGKTLFITGASRGIGKAIALRAARDGANIVVAAKTDQPHSTLPGTIHTAAQEIHDAGGHALPVVCDIRDESQIQRAVTLAIQKFGGIDIVVNNASAISLTTTEETSAKKFDLMHQINTRGTWLVAKHCLPFLKKARNPHILMISPPLSLQEQWFAPHVAYSIAKFGMSLCVLGMAGEFRDAGIAVNALWPLTIIGTAALKMIEGTEQAVAQQRTPEIMADAAHAILIKPSRQFTGNFCIDEVVLRKDGVSDFSKYAAVPGSTEFLPDFFVDESVFDELDKLKAKL